MIIKRHRFHTVRPEDYESINMGATVEIDTSDPEFEDWPFEDLILEADDRLDQLLANDVNRALASGGEHINDSHLWNYYPEEKTK